MAGFDPNEFASFKSASRQAPPASSSSSGFDPAEFDAFKAKPARETMGAGEAALRGAEKGLSFGFGDELRGAAAASEFEQTAPSIVKDSILRYSPLVLGARAIEGVQNLVTGKAGAQERYDAAVAENREMQRQAAEDQPLASIGGELGGALAGGIALPMLAPFKAAQGAGILARGAAAGGNLAATGGAYGAVAGAGEAEGNLLERLPSAAGGAVEGAVLAPAIGGGIAGTMGAGRMVANQARAFTSPATIADQAVGRAVRRDAADLPAIADEMERAAAAGQPYALADAAGVNTRRLAGDVVRTPGDGRQPARQFLEDRQYGTGDVASQGERISDRLGGLLGDRGAIQTADEIMTRRAAAADPAYKMAHDVKLNYGTEEGQKLLSLLDRIPTQAKNEANNILRISDREGSQLIWAPDANGGFGLAAVPNTRQFDYIKRGIDTMIARNTNEVTGELNTLGGALVGLKREILDSVDKLNPAFASARRQYAGETELLDALRQGQRAFQPGMSVEGLSKTMDGLSPGEVDMFRLGASNALRERMGNAGDGVDKVRLAYGNKSIREKLRVLAPDDASRQEFHGYMRRERDMASSFRETGGSPTAERIGDAADTDGFIAQAGSAALQAAGGDPRGAIRTAFQTMGRIDPAKRGAVMAEVRKIVFDPNPETVRAFLGRLEQSNLDAETRRRLIGAVSSAIPRATLEGPAAR